MKYINEYNDYEKSLFSSVENKRVYNIPVRETIKYIKNFLKNNNLEYEISIKDGINIDDENKLIVSITLKKYSMYIYIPIIRTGEKDIEMEKSMIFLHIFEREYHIITIKDFKFLNEINKEIKNIPEIVITLFKKFNGDTIGRNSILFYGVDGNPYSFFINDTSTAIIMSDIMKEMKVNPNSGFSEKLINIPLNSKVEDAIKFIENNI